ncbi:uncharacterized protein EDB93DRAFT_1115208 [Suillus bovinus]|uniref:uncharacterized protein n=1 Tax=Suillus bovinus TaxID=48563 RepID=UPI001B863A40|nr:uncharacterized protein EDB93DRAFT_1115208 [Suillus bovinus]KAG2159358.1 hypothetical protein EDB93DRAFT_1115208 [Suillus bovinus]
MILLLGIWHGILTLRQSRWSQTRRLNHLLIPLNRNIQLQSHVRLIVITGYSHNTPAAHIATPGRYRSNRT